MLAASYTGQFKRDVKLAKKQGKDIDKLKHVMSHLLSCTPLERELMDHPLQGLWKESRDLHIEPDWILIYTRRNNDIYLEIFLLRC